MLKPVGLGTFRMKMGRKPVVVEKMIGCGKSLNRL